MRRDVLSGISSAQFQSAIDQANCVIFYPQASYRNLMLSYVLQLDEYHFLYLKLTDLDTTLIHLCDQLNHLFHSEFDLKASASKTTPQEMAVATANLLKSCPQPVILYMDELDRITVDEAYHAFFSELITQLSDQTKLVINARTLTTEPWREMVQAGIVNVLGSERRETDLMFTPDEGNRPQLEIYAFGRGHAIINGLPVTNWDGALPRNLFFYFIDRDLVTRDEIFNAFWSDLPNKEATNVFHVTKRKISERLSLNVYGDDNYDLTSYSTGFYRPSDQIIRHYDVQEFEEAVDKASMTFDDQQQVELYQRAVSLYRAPFLITLDMPWVHERREKLQRLFLEALIGIARIHKATKQYEASLGYFMRALHEKPLREDLHREVMFLYKELGYTQDAVLQYNYLEELLQDSLGVAPDPESQALLAQIDA